MLYKCINTKNCDTKQKNVLIGEKYKKNESWYKASNWYQYNIFIRLPILSLIWVFISRGSF